MLRTTTDDTKRMRDAGFTVVELIIALFIIAVLIIVAMKAFGGAKKSAYASEAKTVGAAYMQSVSQFQADFANTHPPLSGARRWAGNNSAEARRGPINLTNQAYMKSVPDAVGLGRVGVSVNTNCGTGGVNTPSGATTQTGWVSVCYLAPPRFYVRVSSRKTAGAPWNAANAQVCFMGATTANPKC